jgi:hypothetical protein
MVARPFHDRRCGQVHVNRGLLGWGVFFIVAGSIPVLVQAGVLDPQAVRQVWQLWPLILIGIGLGLILQRTRAGVIGGLIVSATFGILVGGWFAVGFAPGAGLAACGVGGSDPGTPFPTERGTLNPVASVSLDLSCGDAVIATAPGDAWSIDGTSDDGIPPDVSNGGNLRVEAPRGSGISFGRNSSWQVTLPSDVTVDLDLSASAGSLRAVLAPMQVTSLSASVNAGSSVLDLKDTQGLTRIDVSANAGSLGLTLPFPSGPMTGSISANAGTISLCVPTEVPMRITASSALGSNNFSDAGMTKDGDTWTRPGRSDGSIDLDVSANLGTVNLNPDDGCD